LKRDRSRSDLPALPILLALLAGLSGLFQAGTARAGAAADFDLLAERYLAGYYAFHPERATRDGIHEHDSRLGGFSRDDISAEIARLKAATAALESMKSADLDSARKIDLQILKSHATAAILDLETIRRWERDPGYYVGLVTEGVHTLSARPFAPAAERLRSVLARERLIGSVLGAALENVSNPPRAWTELAISRAGQAVQFFRSELPGRFTSVTDAGLMAEFDTLNAQTVLQLESYISYLKQDLLPASRGDFRLGPETFQKVLQSEEMCETPAYRLERYGDDELKRLKLEIQNIAHAIDPDKTPKQLFRMLSVDHPDAPRLIGEAEKTLESLRGFCTSSAIVTLPEARCTVQNTPLFLGLEKTAVLDAPGAFETRGREAFFYVTPPPASADAMTRDDHMRAFNRFALSILAIREAYPGSFVQIEASAKARSRVRRALGSNSFVQGWALYSEQMALDQGYGGKDPDLRLFQLRTALLEACRYLAAIRMHTGAMTFEEAVGLFTNEAYLDRESAEHQARLVTLDATAVASQLGKFQISKLREDYRRFRGPQFTLLGFHDRLLAGGALAMKLQRQLLMPGDKGTIL